MGEYAVNLIDQQQAGTVQPVFRIDTQRRGGMEWKFDRSLEDMTMEAKICGPMRARTYGENKHICTDNETLHQR